MVLTEFDEEKYLEMMREEEWEDGHTAGLKEGHASGLKEGHASGLKEGYKNGLIEGLLSLLTDLGDIPDSLPMQIERLDATEIKKWTKLASKAESMEAFLQMIKTS